MPKSIDQATLERAIASLHEEGPYGLPPNIVDAVLEEESRRLSDPKDGLVYYATHYGMLWVKGIGWERFMPHGRPRLNETTGKDWSWQPKVWSLLTKFYIMLILKARQLGLTFSCSLVALWEAQWHGLRSTQVVAVVTNKMGNSKRLVRRSRDMYRRHPEWLNALSPIANPGITRLEFANGSSIEPFSSRDASRAEAASVVLVDEIGKIEHLDETFADIEACADNGGRIIMWGTVDERMSGVGSILHQWCVDSDNGDEVGRITHSTPDGEYSIPIMQSESGMAFIFLPWYLHADRDALWHENKRRLYKGNLNRFDQEYPTRWEDAFVGSGLSYFDFPSIKREAERLNATDEGGAAWWENRYRRGSLIWENEQRRTVKFVENPVGDVVIHATHDEFESYMQTRRPFAIGVDSAGDRNDGDYNAAAGVQSGNYPTDEHETIEQELIVPARLLATIHGYFDADEYGAMVLKLGYFLGTALITVEMNGVGTAVARHLIRAKYPNLYMRKTKPDKRNQRVTRVVGWHTMNDMKHIAYGETERLLRNGWIEVNDPYTLSEMESVQHTGGGRLDSPRPRHNDRSDALTLACATLEDARVFKSDTYRSPNWSRPAESVDDVLRELEEADRNRSLLGREMAGFLT